MSCPGAEGRDASASRSDAGDRDRRFQRSFRLTARREFAAVYERGRRTSSSSFTLFGIPNDRGHSRLGITVTRKFGDAVRRNRIKRVLRDVFRRHREDLLPGLDLVVNARPGADSRPSAEIETEFLQRFSELVRRFRS